MTILEKTKSSADTTRFTLFKEGLFYKCYNEDAMVFVKKVKDYNVSSKFVKATVSNVYSAGFPVTGVDKGKLSFEEISTKIEAQRFELKNESVIFYLKGLESKKGYNEWVEIQRANNSELIIKEPGPIYSNANNSENVLAMIRNYDLANSTPMQSMHFIQELKSELSKIEV